MMSKALRYIISSNFLTGLRKFGLEKVKIPVTGAIRNRQTLSLTFNRCWSTR